MIPTRLRTALTLSLVATVAGCASGLEGSRAELYGATLPSEGALDDEGWAFGGQEADVSDEVPESSWDGAGILADAGRGGEPAPPAPTHPTPGAPPATKRGEPPADDADGERGGALRASAGAGVEPGRSKPLLIYTAVLHLAVFETVATQDALIELATDAGGFLSFRDDSRVTIRVPAGRFAASLDAIGALGDVQRRAVKGADVTEEFRDLTIRLRNAEAVRRRLEALLERADTVKDALAVQAELAKLSESIELYKGRLRFLEDRIAYSTITVYFQARSQDTVARPNTFRLPFAWLDGVGLRGLLDL